MEPLPIASPNLLELVSLHMLTVYMGVSTFYLYIAVEGSVTAQVTRNLWLSKTSITFSLDYSLGLSFP